MERLLNSEIEANTLSPSTLAFVGDAVFGLLVREELAKTNRPVGVLHSLSVSRVNAVAQAKAYKIIEPILTENEMAIYKRGRNANTNNTPKGASVGQYHSATGLETLFGYLYLNAEMIRMREIFILISNEF